MNTTPRAISYDKLSWLDVPKSIWHFLGKNKFKYVALNVVLFCVLFFDLVPAFVVGKIVDFFTHYKAGQPLDRFYFYAVGLGLASIFIAIVRLTSKGALARISIAAKTAARVEGFERLMDFSLQWHAQESSGNRVQRIFTGSLSIPEWVQLTNNYIFPVATAFIGVLTIFLFLSPIFLLFLTSYTVLFFTIEYIFNRKLKKLSDELNNMREKSGGKYIEGTGNILAIKALGAEKDIHSKLKNTEEDSKHIEIILSNTGINKWYIFQIINGSALVIFLLLVSRQFLAGTISAGYILVFFTYFTTLRESASKVTDISGRVIQLKSDLLRMMPIFLEKPAVLTGSENFPEAWDVISIRDGTFKYPSGQVGVQNLNFSFRRGEKIGIAGPSGSGKSTLVKVLLGLYALERGSFTVGGKDYYSISHDDVMKNVAIVLQETELFNLSLEDNLTLAREVDPALLQAALDIAQLQPVIDRLPEGIGTFVGERGYALSGGERQRIGIARAICKNAPVMLFDEATSALDSKTEKAVMDGLLSKFGDGKTFIIIAHRISTLRGTDRVIVFDKGDVLEEGVYAQLVENKNSHLGQLHALQSEG
jgi:ABC-type multidrug transport system fused ATPase/permease subunit